MICPVQSRVGRSGAGNEGAGSDRAGVYDAAFVEAENTRTVLAALRAVVATPGVFGARYPERAGPVVQTPPAGQPRGRTQVHRVLAQLGIRLIVAPSPPARGRKERFYGTVQGRWPH